MIWPFGPPVFLAAVQFICQPPRQPKTADEAVHRHLLCQMVFSVDQPEYQLPFRLVQFQDELSMDGFDLRTGIRRLGGV